MYASKSQRPFGTATPTSGLKAHLLVPRLINFAPSYCPVGALTTTLVPTMVFRGALTNALNPIAGLPTRLTESLARASARPDRVTLPASSPTRPVTVPQAYGSAAVTNASLPNSPNVSPPASGAPLIVASTSVSGSVGSVRTDPV